MEFFSASPAALRPIVDSNFDCRFGVWSDSRLELPADHTHFGFVASGEATLQTDRGDFPLSAGMYFCLPGGGTVLGSGTGFVATQCNWLGLFQIGGPIEHRGRLRYIDGCSDTLLVSPVVVGDPCLNFLYLPPGTRQSEHVHPSVRIGMIASGAGTCCTPSGDIPLSPGTVFVIPADGQHSFHTDDDELRVIAWHPDSDFGPAHHDHPMINRTIIDGVSAANRQLDQQRQESDAGARSD